jgi:hypothetical protein
MGFLKKEWKTVLFILWLFGITIFLIQINGQLNQLQQKNTKLTSTIDSIESVVISTDANVANSSEKIENIGSNVSFIVQKIRRR